MRALEQPSIAAAHNNSKTPGMLFFNTAIADRADAHFDQQISNSRVTHGFGNSVTVPLSILRWTLDTTNRSIDHVSGNNSAAGYQTSPRNRNCEIFLNDGLRR